MILKLPFCLALVSCFPFVLTAQKLSIGFRGDVNWATMDYLDRKGVYKDVSPLQAIGVALPIEIHFKNNLYIQMEPGYAQKGNSFLITQADENGTPLNINLTRYVLDYVEVPVLLKWTYGNPKIGVDILAGAAIGYGIGGYTAYGSRKTGEVVITSFTFESERLRTPDASLYMGVGLHYAIAKGRVFMDTRYQYGVIDIAEDDHIAKRAYHRGISLNIGCLFDVLK